MEIIDGKIQSYNERGKIIITAIYNDTDRFIKRDYKTCRIALNDSRGISSEQRKKVYALLGEISDFMGEMPEYTKRLFKLKFIHEQMQGLADGIFSLSDCDMTVAKDFITYLTFRRAFRFGNYATTYSVTFTHAPRIKSALFADGKQNSITTTRLEWARIERSRYTRG